MRAAAPVHAVVLASALLVAGPAAAQSSFRARPPETRPEAGNAAVLQAVIDCRRQTDSAARLACFDAAAARLEQAESAGEVVVVDRGQVREARRQIFGFTVPALDLFGARGGAARPEDRVEQVEDTVASTSVDRDGKRIFRLTGGAVWRQYGSEPLRVRGGSRVRITRGLIGSFFMRVDNQPGVRVQRVS